MVFVQRVIQIFFNNSIFYMILINNIDEDNVTFKKVFCSIIKIKALIEAGGLRFILFWTFVFNIFFS